MESQKFDADLMLLSGLLGFEPLACARRPNGDLVYLNSAGQKFILTPAELEKLAHKIQRESGHSHGQGADAPVRPRPEDAGREVTLKPRSHHKKIPC
jgi:hypothetical protein